jgi:preprotein translocase subunit SecA
LIIKKCDHLWQEHLLMMDHLRADVTLRSVGQRDPLMEFKQEAFHLFDAFSKNLRTEIAQDLFRFEIVTRQQPTLQQLLSMLHLETTRSLFADMESAPRQPQAQPELESNREIQPEEEEAKLQPVAVGPKVGRNDLCPCGSGKKYKKCCGQSKDDLED